MPTRTITGTVRHADGSPWANTRIRFQSWESTYTEAATFPRDVKVVTTVDGTFSVALESGLATAWQCQLPDGEKFSFVLPNGAPTTLEFLRAVDGFPVPITPAAEVAINAALEPIEADITALGTILATKVDQSALDALDDALQAQIALLPDNNDISNLQTQINTKASTADLTTLQGIVDNKANTADVTAALALKATVAALTNTQSDLDTAESTIATHTTQISAKANTTDVNTALALKATVADLDAAEVLLDRKVSEYVDIRAHGAVANNTSINNLTAINAAITAAAAASGEVFVPPGTWWVKPDASNWIKTQSNVALHLSPGATIKVRADTGNYPQLISGVTESTPTVNVRIYGGGIIDQNAAGNTGADVLVAAGKYQFGILFYNITGLTIEDVTLNYDGINAVVAHGADVRITNARFNFARGASTNPAYDSSAIYSTAPYTIVSDCTFVAADTSKPGGAVEVHNYNAVVTGNTIYAFGTGVFVTTPSQGQATNPWSQMVIADNSITKCRWGVSLWSYVGHVMRNVTVSGNTIAVDQVYHDMPSFSGISLNYNSTDTGDFDTVAIIGNTVSFVDDNRTQTSAAVALSEYLDAGIALMPKGNVYNVTVTGNVVRNAPYSGILIGNSVSPNTTRGCFVTGNLFVDCGQNAATVTTAYRTHIYLGAASLYNTIITNNVLMDTGSGALRGLNALVALSPLITGEKLPVVTDNYIQSRTGTLTYSVDRTRIWDGEASFTFDFPNLAAESTADTTTTVSGAATGDWVFISPSASLTAGLMLTAWVSAANTVNVRLANVSAGSIDMFTLTFRIKIVKRNGLI